jgi:hypothetical protein
MVSPPPYRGAELLTFDQKVSRMVRKTIDQMVANEDDQIAIWKVLLKTET